METKEEENSDLNRAAMLSTGAKLGPYEILAAIGAGGMGEVYRARDTNLGRDVAIKVLPEAFASDSERMARFGREAKLLASLNHSNIASIYGLETSGNSRALVMELAQGPTLADRIAQGPIPIEDALRIARQICDALEYAHEKGIIHRDLKPTNIKVAPDDSVKILDFGLAKAMETGPSAEDIANSPTLSRMATQTGVLLGTASYMSPEQAKAKQVDRRADIWAFGCVLYETLTGKKAFDGDAVTETLAAVLKNEPDWSLLPAATPMRVRVLLRRCLQKDPKQRLRDIGDARISLDEVLSGAPEAAPGLAAVLPAWRHAMPWAAGLLAVAIASLVTWFLKPIPKAASAQLLRYEIFPPGKASFGGAGRFALSPDGRHLAFTATTPDGNTQIWVRDLDSLISRPLPGTTEAEELFWSPDSRTLAFQQANKLERVDVSGGSPQEICDVDLVLGGSWSSNGTIIFGGYHGVLSVSASGGTPSPVTRLDTARNEVTNSGPFFLPDGLHFLYFVGSPGAAEGTYLGRLSAAGEQAAVKPLVAAASRATYLSPAGSALGHILFLQDNGALMAQAFDATRSEVEGNPAPIANSVDYFTTSDNGVLAYSGGNTAPLQLTWFDRHGKVLGTVGDPSMIEPWPAISPDGNSVAVARADLVTGGQDLWLYYLKRGTQSRLTFDGKQNDFPVWSPDGSHIAFVSSRDGAVNVYQMAVNGMGQAVALEPPSGFRVPADWSRDGHYLIEGVIARNHVAVDVLLLSPGARRKSVPYLDEPFAEVNPRVSPNGQWIAYDSEETGRDEIFVQTFPKRGGKWPVSIEGGTRPRWSTDGKELYFIGLDGKLMEVDVSIGPGGTFQGSAPKALFDSHIAGDRFRGYDVAKEGRFLIPVVAGNSGAPITVVVNWPALLKK